MSKFKRKSFGRYQIQDKLDEGGMGAVYRAFDPSLERIVAVKVLPIQFLDEPEFRSRFAQEAKAIATLQHQAIVPIYDYGEDEGQPYLVMRFMEGGSISDKLKKKKRISLIYTNNVLQQIAAALDMAHQRNIIHRDLKPGNILQDKDENAYLGDFGIVKILRRHDARSTGSTIVGTPAYMSPEQAQGDEVSLQSDIYGLGAVVFEMLSGHQPYQADSITEMLWKQVYEPPPDILKYVPDLPVACSQVLMKAMNKNPQLRFASASIMAVEFAKASRYVNGLFPLNSGEKSDVSSEAENVPQPIALDDDTGKDTTTPVVGWRPLDIDLED